MNSREELLDFLDSISYFNTESDIPDIPKVDDVELYKELVVPAYIRCGAIPKKDLIVGRIYYGSCRNSSTATWNGKEFEYTRYKFGSTYTDTINHFEDDDGYDLLFR